MGMDLVVDIFFTIKLIKGAIFTSPSCEHLPYISFQFTYDFYPSKHSQPGWAGPSPGSGWKGFNKIWEGFISELWTTWKASSSR